MCQILRCTWTLPSAAARTHVAIGSLADRLRAETVAGHGVMTTWSFITAWAPVPGS